ncbi:MAG TPA: thiamine pyrophosphate-dependent enzyme, partial [Kribbellaceae bacterium]
TSDDPTRYRIASEVEAWQAKDPIARVRAFLEKQQLADADFFASVDEEAKREAVHLRERVLAMPDPEPSKIFDHVYVEKTPQLAEQQAQFAAYAASFEGSH